MLGLLDLGLGWFGKATTLIHQVADLYQLAKVAIFMADYLGIIVISYFAVKTYEIYMLRKIYKNKDK